MSQKNVNVAVAAILGTVGLLHLLRLIFGWEAIIASWIVPPWVSVVAIAVAWYIAFNAHKLSR